MSPPPGLLDRLINLAEALPQSVIPLLPTGWPISPVDRTYLGTGLDGFAHDVPALLNDTTLPVALGVSQNRAQSSISLRRFWNRSLRW
jgi:hypothetical protein